MNETRKHELEALGEKLRARTPEEWYPSSAEQAMAAIKAIELYYQITAMCGDHKGLPAPFDDIYSTLMKHRFDLERLVKV